MTVPPPLTLADHVAELRNSEVTAEVVAGVLGVTEVHVGNSVRHQLCFCLFVFVILCHCPVLTPFLSDSFAPIV